MTEPDQPSRPAPAAPDAPARHNRLWLRILRAPLVVLVALYFLLDDVVLAAVRPLVAWAAGLRLFVRLSAWFDRLSPYPTLALFAVPFIVLEPPKLISLYLIGTGHFRSGVLMLVTSHLLSIVLIERLFHVSKPKLMRIGWFAYAFGQVMRLRDWALGQLEAMGIMAPLRALLRRLRQGTRVAVAGVKPMIAAAARTVGTGLARLKRWFKANSAG